MIRLLLKSLNKRYLSNDATEGYFRALVKNASKSNNIGNIENLVDENDIDEISKQQTKNSDSQSNKNSKLELKNNNFKFTSLSDSRNNQNNEKPKQKYFKSKDMFKKSNDLNYKNRKNHDVVDVDKPEKILKKTSTVNAEWSKAKEKPYKPKPDPRQSIKVESIEEYLEVEDRILDEELAKNTQKGRNKKIPLKLENSRMDQNDSLFAPADQIEEQKPKLTQSQLIFKIAAENAHELKLRMKENENLEELQKDEDDIETIIRNLRPAHRPFAYNLAYFVNDSEVLRKFIEMGIPIRDWDRDRNVAEFMLTLNFEKHVAPYLIFFHNLGLKTNEYANIIHENPLIFKESLDDLKVRVDYLESKKFSRSAIVQILSKNPKWLSIPIDNIDANLGWFQREFNLKANELRQIVVKQPLLITKPLKVASDMKFYLREILMFDEQQITSIIKQDPKVFCRKTESIMEAYRFLVDVAKFNNQQLTDYPEVMRASLVQIKSRYSFLKTLKLDQFDPTKPNYVSLKDLIETDDKYFCTKIAKSSIQEYESFLKSL